MRPRRARAPALRRRHRRTDDAPGGRPERARRVASPRAATSARRPSPACTTRASPTAICAACCSRRPAAAATPLRLGERAVGTVGQSSSPPAGPDRARARAPRGRARARGGGRRDGAGADGRRAALLEDREQSTEDRNGGAGALPSHLPSALRLPAKLAALFMHPAGPGARMPHRDRPPSRSEHAQALRAGRRAASALAAVALVVTLATAQATARRRYVAGPHRRRHRRLRLRGERRARRADDRGQLDPVRGSGGRPELLPVRRPAPSTTSTSTTPATASTTSATGSSFKTQIRNKNSFLYALPGVRVDRRPEAERRSRPTTSRARRTSNGQAALGRSVIARNLPVAPNNVGPKTIPNYDAVADQAIRTLPGRRQGVRRPASTIRSSSTSATTFDAHQHPQRHRQRGRRQGRSGGLQRPHDHPAGPQVARSPVTARPSPVPTARRTRWWACGRTHRPRGDQRGRGAIARNRRATVRSRSAASGNPLVNEVIIPLGKKDYFNRPQPAERPENFGKYVALAGARQGHEHPVPGLERARDQPDRHRQALLTGIPGLTQIAPERAADRHAEDQPRRAARTRRPNRFGVLAATRRGSRTGAGSPTTSSDIELRVVGGFLKGNKLPLGDGVDSNDVPSAARSRTSHRRTAASTRSSSATSRSHDPTPVSRRRQATEAAPAAPPPLAARHHDPPPSAPPSHPPRRPRGLRGRRRRLRADRAAIGAAPEPARLGAGVAAFPAPSASTRSGSPPPGDPARRPAQTPTRLAYLAAAYLQRVRETGDAGFYTRADGVLRARAGAAIPATSARSPSAGSAGARPPRLPRAACATARRCAGSRPELVKPYGVLVDALVELGRYGEAGATLQRMVDLKPTLASYARVSYFRELHGDLAGAEQAMRLAVSAGGDAPENVAYVQTLLGQPALRPRSPGAGRLRLPRGPVAVPGLRPGQRRAGPARRRPRPATGPRSAATARRSPACPCPSTSCALGETELAAGRDRGRPPRPRAGRRRGAAAARQRRRHRRRPRAVRGQPRQPRAGRGAGPPGLGLGAERALGRRRSGWALTRAGPPAGGAGLGRRALRLGSRDPPFLYHAGLAARAAGAARPGAGAGCAARWPRTRASRRSTRRGPGAALEAL